MKAKDSGATASTEKVDAEEIVFRIEIPANRLAHSIASI